MNRDDLIDDALRKINGARQEEYGDVYDSFTTISLGWDIITKNALATHGCVSPMHVGLMMDWLKTSRLLVDISHEDSWIDKVGYAALSAEVADEYNDRALDALESGGVSPDAQPEEVEVEVEVEVDVETKKWLNQAVDYAKEFAEQEKKYLAKKGVLGVYKDLLKNATLDELDAMAKYSSDFAKKPKTISRAQLAAELEPGLNALFGMEYDPYVEPKTCQKIDGRTRKPCGLPLVGRQKKFCSKHVPNNTKAARKYYGKRSKRQVNNQL